MVTCEACPLCEVLMWKIISSLSEKGSLPFGAFIKLPRGDFEWQHLVCFNILKSLPVLF